MKGEEDEEPSGKHITQGKCHGIRASSFSWVVMRKREAWEMSCLRTAERKEELRVEQSELIRTRNLGV